MTSCFLKDGPGDVGNLFVVDGSIGVDEPEPSLFLGGSEGKVAVATPVFAEVFVLPVEVRLKVVFHELAHLGVASELAHQHWNAEPLHISEAGVHCLERLDGGTFEVVAEDGLVAVYIASRSMLEATGESEVESDGLEADVGIFVDCSDGRDHAVVEALELKPLGDSREQQEGVSDGISDEGFVDEFIGHHVGVTLEGLGQFLPVLYEFFVEVAASVVQFVEDTADIVAEVVHPPLIVVALIPVRLPGGVHVYLLARWEGESLVAFDLVDQPDWHSIPTEFFRNYVLVEVEHRVNAVFA
jgi:hypothetical protein